MLRIFSHSIVTAAVALGATVGASVALADDDFPLAGTYTQNVPCKGDGTDAAADQVKISTKEIVSNVGTCTVQDFKRDGDDYVNDAAGKSKVTIAVHISGGIGEVYLELGSEHGIV